MFLICKEQDELKVYDTSDGSIEEVSESDIDKAVIMGMQIENIDGKYNLDSKLATKIVYGANSNGDRCASAYLSYECTVVYKEGKAYVLVGKYNPIQKGINQFVFRYDDKGFILQSRTKFEQISIQQSTLSKDSCVVIDCKSLLGTPQVMLNKESYILHILKSEKFMNRIHSIAMNSLMSE